VAGEFAGRPDVLACTDEDLAGVLFGDGDLVVHGGGLRRPTDELRFGAGHVHPVPPAAFRGLRVS
jgi:hypothetical protein